MNPKNCLQESRQQSRREALSCLGVIAGVAISPSNVLPAAERVRPKKILLRSSWQTVNIGDIAHTPGLLKLLENYLPDVEVTLWPSSMNDGVKELLQKRFPKLKIAKKGSPQLKQAFQECDFLLHSSGPSLVAEKDLVQWALQTGKPYGVFGITLPQKKSSKISATSEQVMKKTIQVLNDAQFVYFRDSVSLQFAKSKGCQCPVMEFGPDAAFAVDLRDDKKANAFLKKNQLETGNFLCCIPRLRYTPYWWLPNKKWAYNKTKEDRNEAMKEHDHKYLRQAIIEVIQQTDLKVLICPEDETQMKVGRELLYNPLPKEIKKRVVWRPNYWLTGEAVSTYVQSAGLFGNEMHSPIMCIGNGVPAIVCRWAEQTSKGIMWEDIGLEEWLFDMDDKSKVTQIVPTVLSMAKNPDLAKQKAAKALKFVQQRQKKSMNQLAKELRK